MVLQRKDGAELGEGASTPSPASRSHAGGSDLGVPSPRIGVGVPPSAAPSLGRARLPLGVPGGWCKRLPSPVGAAEAVALAGGEVGLVDGLDVGLGVGGRPALRHRGTDSAAAERGAGQAPARNQPAAAALGRRGSPDLSQPRTWLLSREGYLNGSG